MVLPEGIVVLGLVADFRTYAFYNDMPGRCALKNLVIAFHLHGMIYCHEKINFVVSRHNDFIQILGFMLPRHLGRVLTISDIKRSPKFGTSKYGRSNTNRGATPMRADAAWATPGFSGAPPSGPRSHPRATSLAALRCARSDRFASAKQRSPSARVHCPAASAPLAQLRVRGANGQKNPPRTARAAKAMRTRTSIGSMPMLVMVRVACASPRSAEGFLACPQHA